MTPPRALKLREGRRLELGVRPLLMGALNSTPDSFSDGGLYVSPETALRRALELLAEGAAIIDIGGESTRPGSAELSIEEETRRVAPLVAMLRRERPDCPISVDTRKAGVAKAALAAGADLINDVSGLQFSPEIAELAAKEGAALCLMHMRGTPATMQNPENLVYKDLLGEIAAFLGEAAKRAEDCGVPREAIALDPGLGFSKSLEQNVKLMAEMERFHLLGYPLLVGPSRKSFIGSLSGVSKASERDFGTCGAAACLALKGVQIIRVHNVKAVRQALDVFCPCAL
jgi:dihydropteroate synthase